MASRPPEAYLRFIDRYPRLAEAWDLMRSGERQAGPLDDRTRALVKIAVAAGAMREGAVRSAARKARSAGVTDAEIEQVVALAASTVGLPSAVALHSWISEALDGDERAADRPR